MARKPVVKIDFILKSIPDKLEFAQLVHDHVKANPLKFVTPDLDLLVFQQDIDELRNQYGLAQAGDHVAEEKVKNLVKVMNDDLRVMAKYVSRVAKGDAAVIVLAGFTSTKTEIVKSKRPVKGVLTGMPGTEIGGIAFKGEKLEFAIHYVFVVGRDLSGLTYKNDTVIAQPKLIDPTDPTKGIYPIVIKTHKLPTVEIDGLDTRVNYECVYFGVSTVGNGDASDVIIVASK